MTRRNQLPKSLIEVGRINEITAIGQIDGGTWADVLAVSYGPAETLIRLRLEETGNRYEFMLPPDKPLEEALRECAQMLNAVFPYSSKPQVMMYRGRRARKWVERFMARAKKSAEEYEAAGVKPVMTDYGPMIRVTV